LTQFVSSNRNRQQEQIHNLAHPGYLWDIRSRDRRALLYDAGLPRQKTPYRLGLAVTRVIWHTKHSKSCRTQSAS
jgi:hypothetical protein